MNRSGFFGALAGSLACVLFGNCPDAKAKQSRIDCRKNTSIGWTEIGPAFDSAGKYHSAVLFVHERDDESVYMEEWIDGELIFTDIFRPQESSKWQ